jgi:hypothetical protein
MKVILLKYRFLPAVLALVVLVAVYLLALRPTIELWRANRVLESEFVAAVSPEYQQDFTERKLANISKILKGYRADSMSFKSKLSSVVATLAERQHVKLTDVPDERNAADSNKFVLQQLQLRGDFFSLLRLYHELEHVPETGYIRTVAFTAQDQPGTGERSGLIDMSILFIGIGRQEKDMSQKRFK